MREGMSGGGEDSEEVASGHLGRWRHSKDTDFCSKCEQKP